jgi:hypothetical protein
MTRESLYLDRLTVMWLWAGIAALAIVSAL